MASRNMLCSRSVHDSRLLVIVYGLRVFDASGCFMVDGRGRSQTNPSRETAEPTAPRGIARPRKRARVRRASERLDATFASKSTAPNAPRASRARVRPAFPSPRARGFRELERSTESPAGPDSSERTRPRAQPRDPEPSRGSRGGSRNRRAPLQCAFACGPAVSSPRRSVMCRAKTRNRRYEDGNERANWRFDRGALDRSPPVERSACAFRSAFSSGATKIFCIMSFEIRLEKNLGYFTFLTMFLV